MRQFLLISPTPPFYASCPERVLHVLFYFVQISRVAYARRQEGRGAEAPESFSLGQRTRSLVVVSSKESAAIIYQFGREDIASSYQVDGRDAATGIYFFLVCLEYLVRVRTSAAAGPRSIPSHIFLFDIPHTRPF